MLRVTSVGSVHVGPKFLKMTSRPGFFNNGKTKASFQISGKPNAMTTLAKNLEK